MKKTIWRVVIGICLLSFFVGCQLSGDLGETTGEPVLQEGHYLVQELPEDLTELLMDAGFDMDDIVSVEEEIEDEELSTRALTGYCRSLTIKNCTYPSHSLQTSFPTYEGKASHSGTCPHDCTYVYRKTWSGVCDYPTCHRTALRVRYYHSY